MLSLVNSTVSDVSVKEDLGNHAIRGATPNPPKFPSTPNLTKNSYKRCHLSSDR